MILSEQIKSTDMTNDRKECESVVPTPLQEDDDETNQINIPFIHQRGQLELGDGLELEHKHL